MEALKKLQELAEKGDKRSQLELARKFRSMKPKSRSDFDEAFKWYRTVAEGKIDDRLDESFYAKRELVEFGCSLRYCDTYIVDGEEYINTYELPVEELLKWCFAALADLDTIKQNYPDIDFNEKKEDIVADISAIYRQIDLSIELDCSSENMNYHKQAVLLGINEAAKVLGKICLENGDEKEALKWFEQGECHFEAGLIYKYGKIEKDYPKALETFNLVIANGEDRDFNDEYNRTKFELGDLYYNGWGTPKNFEEAAKCYRYTRVKFYKFRDELYIGTKEKEIIQNDEYNHDNYIERALECFLNYLSFEPKGYGENKEDVLYHIGNIYNLQLNNKLKAFYCYKKATSSRLPAWEELKKIYSLIRNNEEEVLKWFEKENSSEFYYFLGLLYIRGEGFEQSYSKALEAFKLAIKTTMKYYNFDQYAWASLDCKRASMFELGELYYNGWGVSKNFEEAAKWYKLADEKSLFSYGFPRKLDSNDLLQDIDLDLPFPEENVQISPF